MEKMVRKEAREFVMQVLFQMDAQKDFENTDFEKCIGEKKLGGQKEYVMSALSNTVSHLAEIDGIIDEKSEGWPSKRMAKTDLAVMRLAVCEIKYFDDIPKAVTVNEAVELAKVYGTDASPKFINAVLAKID